MSNQIDTLFGEAHDRFLDRLKKASGKRKKRVIVKKAVRATTDLIKLKGNELTLLITLRERLRDYDQALEDGVDGKLAQRILEARDG